MSTPVLQRNQGGGGFATFVPIDVSTLYPHDSVQNVAAIVSTATTNAQVLSTTPAHLIGIDLYNSDVTNAAYLKLYDKATAPVPGTDTPVMVFEVSQGGTSGHLTLGSDQINYEFKVGIGLALTKLPALNDATALVTAGSVSGTITF